MSKRCMPGVICIENATIMMIIVIVSLGIFFLNFYNNKGDHHRLGRENIYMNDYLSSSSALSLDGGGGGGGNIGFFPRFNFGYSNSPDDVLLNPYKAPLRDDRYFPGRGGDVRGGIPINIQTQSGDSAYRQVGILTRMNGAEMILPLMGRPLFTNRDKWNFYTMSDKNAMIKLPLTNKGRSCTDEYGCDNLYNGDSVYVEGYNDAFKVTVYDNQVMRYIPFL